MARQAYPLALSLTSALTSALGLSAAALGIQWGAAPARHDALPLAWLYVHIMLLFTWLVLWPALALTKNPRPSPGTRGRPPDPPSDTAARRATAPPTPAWDAAAIALGALPALTVAAFVSAIPLTPALNMLALQLGAALLTLGILHARPRLPQTAALASLLVATLTLTGPILTFLCLQFFPHFPPNLLLAFPLIAMSSAPASTFSLSATIAGMQALTGLLLAAAAKWICRGSPL